LISAIEKLKREALHAPRARRKNHVATPAIFVFIEQRRQIFGAILAVAVHNQHHLRRGEFVKVTQAERNGSLVTHVAAQM
jgi:hypothetical protein